MRVQQVLVVGRKDDVRQVELQVFMTHAKVKRLEVTQPPPSTLGKRLTQYDALTSVIDQPHLITFIY